MAQEVDTKPKEKTPSGWAKHWQTQMTACEKRTRRFTRQGNRVSTRYLGGAYGESGSDSSLDDQGLSPVKLMKMNFFHTNIQTLQAQLYGSVPKVDVKREFNDPNDDVARVAALLYKRILQAEIECSDEAFPTAVRSALHDRLVPGLGICRVRYEMETNKEIVLNPSTGEEEEIETLGYEKAPIDYVHWQDFRWGWCRTWTELPWCAFRSYLDKEAAIERFGEEIANELVYQDQSPSGMDSKDEFTDRDQANNIQTAQIWEIWNKKDRKVYWWSEGYEKTLDIKEDPLQLENFWPMPRPLMANLTTSLMTPKADYTFAQDLYNEIDIIGTRIANITAACKVVGIYDSSTGDSVGRMLQEGTENTLIPVENWAVLGEKGGLKGVIDMFPVEDIASVLQLLNNQLRATIDALYEVTGMSDLVSGGKTDEYTSDGTNRLKAKFGSIKIQSFQDEFARFCSDLEAIKAEVISKHFDPMSIIQQSSAQYLSPVDLPLVHPAIQLMQSPEVKWRVSIKPESISLMDYAELQSERVGYMNAVATFLQSAAPIIEQAPDSKPLILEILKFGLSAFKGSDYMEGLFDKMIEAELAKQDEEQSDPEADKVAAQNEADMAKIQAKSQADIALTKVKAQAEQTKIQMDNQADIASIQAKAQADMQAMMQEMQNDMKILMTKLSADTQIERAQSAYSIEEKDVDLQNQIAIETLTHRNAMMLQQQQAQNDMRLAEEQGEPREEE